MSRIIGIDEAGRGPLAGPLVVAAVATPVVTPDWWDTVGDSKKMTNRRRAKLYALLMAEEYDIQWSCVFVSAEKLDRQGMSMSMARACKSVLISVLAVERLPVWVDGDTAYGVGSPLVHGDGILKEIGAASIIAKEQRDQYMRNLDDSAGYGYAQHKGYPTKSHRKRIELVGPSSEHRRLVRWIGEKWGPRVD